MYHPLEEVTDEDVHEFVEIYNDEQFDVSLMNWRLVTDGNMRFKFPDNAVIKSKTYCVIAKDVGAYRAVYGVSLCLASIVVRCGSDRIFFFCRSQAMVRAACLDRTSAS